MVKSVLAILGIGVALALPANADFVIFDSLNGGEAQSPTSGDQGYGVQLFFSTNVTITAIGAKLDLNTNGNLKFVIYDGDTKALLYATTGQFFNDDGDTWKVSNPLSFTFLSGKTYDVGAVSEMGALWDYDLEPGSQNGISSQGDNGPIIATYSSLQDGQTGGADGAIRLLVPEPSSLTLIALSVGLFCSRRNLKRRITSPDCA